MLAIKPRMTNKLWAWSAISIKHMTSWCLFLDSHLTTHHSNIGVQLRHIAKLNTLTLWLCHLRLCAYRLYFGVRCKILKVNFCSQGCRPGKQCCGLYVWYIVLQAPWLDPVRQIGGSIAPISCKAVCTVCSFSLYLTWIPGRILDMCIWLISVPGFILIRQIFITRKEARICPGSCGKFSYPQWGSKFHQFLFKRHGILFLADAIKWTVFWNFCQLLINVCNDCLIGSRVCISSTGWRIHHAKESMLVQGWWLITSTGDLGHYSKLWM